VEGEREGAMGSMGSCGPRSGSGDDCLGLRAQTQNVLRTRLYIRPLRERSACTELAGRTPRAHGELFWEHACSSHLFFPSAARTRCKAVRRSRFAIRACRLGGSHLLLGSACPAPSKCCWTVRCILCRCSAYIAAMGGVLPCTSF